MAKILCAIALILVFTCLVFADDNEENTVNTGNDEEKSDSIIEKEPADENNVFPEDTEDSAVEDLKPDKNPADPGNTTAPPQPLSGAGPQPAEKPVPDFPALQPVPFQTPDGCKGWKLRLGSASGLPTPAYSNGLIFAGNGTCRGFYAINAETGEIAWSKTDTDSGPTSPIVQDDLVIFNTASCTIYALNAKTGRTVWSKWLASTLSNQPAVIKDKVISAYPNKKKGYTLTCLNSRTGFLSWNAKLPNDIVSAPVISDDSVTVTTLDGRMTCFNLKNGKIRWTNNSSGIIAPVIHDDSIFSVRQDGDGKGILAVFDTKKGSLQVEKKIVTDKPNTTESTAIKNGTPDGQLIMPKQASPAPPPAKIPRSSMHNLIYEGPRPCVADGLCYAVDDNRLACLDIKTRETVWEYEAPPGQQNTSAEIYTSPVSAGNSIIVCSNNGTISVFDKKNGTQTHKYSIEGKIVMQPIAAKGKIITGTSNGILYCIDTGNPGIDGWYMWGGGPEHNGTAQNNNIAKNK